MSNNFKKGNTSKASKKLQASEVSASEVSASDLEITQLDSLQAIMSNMDNLDINQVNESVIYCNDLKFIYPELTQSILSLLQDRQLMLLDQIVSTNKVNNIVDVDLNDSLNNAIQNSFMSKTSHVDNIYKTRIGNSLSKLDQLTSDNIKLNSNEIQAIIKDLVSYKRVNGNMSFRNNKGDSIGWIDGKASFDNNFTGVNIVMLRTPIRDMLISKYPNEVIKANKICSSNDHSNITGYIELSKLYANKTLLVDYYSSLLALNFNLDVTRNKIK